jgi:hypothetical protein
MLYFILGIIVGIILAKIAFAVNKEIGLYDREQTAKTERLKQPQIIKRTTPVQNFLKDDI